MTREKKTEKIDVVIPTRGEWTLPYCVSAARKSIPVNRLIFVCPNNSFAKALTLSEAPDICVVFDEANVGRARAEGLKRVETPVFASIDSDVMVTPEWFKWCSEALKPSDVAATQGFAKTQGRYYPKLQEDYIRKGGKYGRGFCCLGNVLLKTDVIRKLSMPEVRVEEDWQLRLKVEKAGYKWAANLDIICPHIKSDMDVWRHAVWWGRMGGEVNALRCLERIPYYLSFGLKQRPLGQNLFLVGLNLHLLYGISKRLRLW
jgi:hypothetical protein